MRVRAVPFAGIEPRLAAAAYWLRWLVYTLGSGVQGRSGEPRASGGLLGAAGVVVALAGCDGEAVPAPPERALACGDGDWVADYPASEVGLAGSLEDAVRTLLAGRVRRTDRVERSPRTGEAYVLRDGDVVLVASLHQDERGGWHLGSAQGCIEP